MNNNLQFIPGHHPQRASAEHTGMMEKVLGWRRLQGPVPLPCPHLTKSPLYGRPFLFLKGRMLHTNSVVLWC